MNMRNKEDRDAYRFNRVYTVFRTIELLDAADALQTDLLCATELNKKYEQLCKDSSALAERLQKENKKLRALLDKKSAEPKEILAAIDALSSRAVSYGGARNANNLASVRRAKKHLIEILGVKDE